VVWEGLLTTVSGDLDLKKSSSTARRSVRTPPRSNRKHLRPYDHHRYNARHLIDDEEGIFLQFIPRLPPHLPRQYKHPLQIPCHRYQIQPAFDVLQPA